MICGCMSQPKYPHLGLLISQEGIVLIKKKSHSFPTNIHQRYSPGRTTGLLLQMFDFSAGNDLP